MKKLWLLFKRLRYVILAFIITFGFILSVPLYVKYKARHKIYSNVENLESKNFAIVLGAGIRRNGTPGSYLKKRLDDVLILYKAGKINKILISGDNGNSYHDEISTMNNYLVNKGVPQQIIFGDYAGFDTYTSMERADKIFGIKEAIVVSQGFHLPRAIYIARQKGIDATGFVKSGSYGKRRNFAREYLATIKSFFDCLRHRKAKYYGDKIDVSNGSNIP